MWRREECGRIKILRDLSPCGLLYKKKISGFTWVWLKEPLSRTPPHDFEGAPCIPLPTQKWLPPSLRDFECDVTVSTQPTVYSGNCCTMQAIANGFWGPLASPS